MRATVLLLVLFCLPGCASGPRPAPPDPEVPLDALSDGISPLGQQLARQHVEQEPKPSVRPAAPAERPDHSSFLGELFDGAPTLRDFLDELGS